jgi:hypothetical protein
MKIMTPVNTAKLSLEVDSEKQYFYPPRYRNLGLNRVLLDENSPRKTKRPFSMLQLNAKNTTYLCQQGGPCFTLLHFVYEYLLSIVLIRHN